MIGFGEIFLFNLYFTFLDKANLSYATDGSKFNNKSLQHVSKF